MLRRKPETAKSGQTQQNPNNKATSMGRGPIERDQEHMGEVAVVGEVVEGEA